MAWSYLLEVDNKFQEKIKFASGIEFWQDTWVDGVEKVTLSGIIRYMMPIAAERLGLNIGDRVYFRYDVVGDYEIVAGRREYKNFVMVGGKEFWAALPDMILAVERRGDMVSVGEWVIGRFMDKHKSFNSGIILNTGLSELVDDSILTVEMPGSEFMVGSRLKIDNRFVQRYNFTGVHGDEMIVIRSRYIFGEIKKSKQVAL